MVASPKANKKGGGRTATCIQDFLFMCQPDANTLGRKQHSTGDTLHFLPRLATELHKSIIGHEIVACGGLDEHHRRIVPDERTHQGLGLHFPVLQGSNRADPAQHGSLLQQELQPGRPTALSVQRQRRTTSSVTGLTSGWGTAASYHTLNADLSARVTCNYKLTWQGRP